MESYKYWVKIENQPAPENRILHFKIDDEHGCRNECQLIRIGNLYYHTDKSTYVYFTPTHWSY